MSGFRRGAALALVAVSALAAPRAAQAQQPDSTLGVAPTADSVAYPGPLPISGVASLVQPRRITYALTRITDTAAVHLGERLVEVQEATYGEVPAWSIVERMRGAIISAGEDSLLLRRDDLSPLRWQSILGNARLAAEFARDTVYAALQAPASRQSFTVAVPHAVVPSAGALERWLEAVPLSDYWFATVPLLVVDLGGARVIDATIEVAGSDSVHTPLGAWDAWRVVLRAGEAEKRFWVRKHDRLVLRSHQLLPGSSGHALETLLTGEESPIRAEPLPPA